MKIIILMMALLLIQIQIAQSADVNLFNQRFSFKRNSNGVLVAVIDRSLIGMTQNLKARDFIQGTLEELIQLSQDLRAQGHGSNLSLVIQDFLSLNITQMSPENNQKTARALLASLDTEKLRQLIKHPEWEKVYAALDFEVGQIGDDYAILARPDSRLYYYKRNLFSGISKSITSLIKSLLPFGAWMDIVNFLSKKFIDTLHENKKFHKNILLYYVRNFSAEELGLSELEVKKILSSLYDDEMPLYAVWDLWDAIRDWPSYGEVRLWKAMNKVEKGIKKYSGKFRSLDERWGDYYYLATNKKGHRLVLNFMDPVYYFTRFPSVGMYLDKRWANILERSLYEVVKLAVRFLPWGFVGTVVDPLLNIRYKDQIEHEGSLLAYLEGNDEEFSLIRDVVRQSINPFIIRTGTLHDRNGTNDQRRPSLMGDFNGLLDY
ncbi:MAG: hypothetical protein HYV97_04905 [Bdellovibrio sp.]|nr:hypothetical protein [Bdellovibrio sp.]